MSTLLLKLTSNASVRGTVAPDGSQRFSVYDFICVACQKPTSSNYGRVTYSRLISDDSEFKDEVGLACYNLKFAGSGQRETPTMTLRGLQRLLLILGSKVASEFRVLLEGTFTRVMAGDPSLIEVISSNAASDAPIHQAYRQALAQEPVAPVLDEIVRKRKAEEDQALFEMEMTERHAKVKDGYVARIKDFVSVMDMLNADWKSDARLCLQLQDSLKNVVLNNGNAPVSAITNGDPPPTQSLTIGEMAQRMGFSLKHADQVAIGHSVSKAYLKKHGKKPSKCRRWVDGAEREVNAYTEADRHLIEAAVRERMGESDEGSD